MADGCDASERAWTPSSMAPPRQEAENTPETLLAADEADALLALQRVWSNGPRPATRRRRDLPGRRGSAERQRESAGDTAEDAEAALHRRIQQRREDAPGPIRDVLRGGVRMRLGHARRQDEPDPSRECQDPFHLHLLRSGCPPAVHLPGMPACVHAPGIRVAIALVLLLVLVQAVQRPDPRAHDAADRRSL